MAKDMKAKAATKPSKKESKKQETIAYVGEYNGKPMFKIGLDEEEEWPKLSMGLTKSKLVIEHLEELRAFVESGGETV